MLCTYWFKHLYQTGTLQSLQFWEAVLLLLFFKDRFLNNPEYVEKHILQMFSYNTWIFSSLVMNKWLTCGRFLLQLINENIFLHQKSHNINWPLKFGWAFSCKILWHLPFFVPGSTPSCSAQPHCSGTEVSSCRWSRRPLCLQPVQPFPEQQALGLGHSESDLMHRQFEKVQMAELSALNLSSSNLSPLSQASRLLNLSITV